MFCKVRFEYRRLINLFLFRVVAVDADNIVHGIIRKYSCLHCVRTCFLFCFVYNLVRIGLNLFYTFYLVSQMLKVLNLSLLSFAQRFAVHLSTCGGDTKF